MKTVIANQWQYVTANIPHDTGGPTQLLDNSGAYQILIAGVSGTTFQSPVLDAWQSGNYFTHSSGTNWTSVAGAFIRFAQCQIRSGFRGAEEMRDGYIPHAPTYIQELQACQRYYEKSYSLETIPGTNTPIGGFSIGGQPGNISIGCSFKTSKRAVPIVVTYSITGGFNGSSSSLTSGDNLGGFNNVISSTESASFGFNSPWGRAWQWTAESEF
jgi:hypothetical protein